MNSTVILGIDPGLAHTGWGIIAKQGNKLIPLAYDCIETYASQPLPYRMHLIAHDIEHVIQKYQPQVVSIESIFFGANTKTAMLTAQARGAALSANGMANMLYAEYTPLQIKQAIVGTGAADKTQVQYMVKSILKFDHMPKPDHCADALAAAICYARMHTYDYITHELEKQ